MLDGSRICIFSHFWKVPYYWTWNTHHCFVCTYVDHTGDVAANNELKIQHNCKCFSVNHIRFFLIFIKIPFLRVISNLSLVINLHYLISSLESRHSVGVRGPTHIDKVRQMSWARPGLWSLTGQHVINCDSHALIVCNNPASIS